MQQQNMFPLNVQFTIYSGDTVTVTEQDDTHVTFLLNGQVMRKTHYIFKLMTGDMCKELFAQGLMQ